MSDYERRDRPSATRLRADGLAEAIVQTIGQPLLVLSADLVVEEANAAFYELFKASAKETLGRRLYELGNGQWDIADLRHLLEQVLPECLAVQEYRIEHKFPEIGKRVMILNAKLLAADNGRPDLILLAVSDRTETEQVRFELEGHQEFLEKLIDSIREALLVLDLDLKVVRANQPFYTSFQVFPAETEGRLVYELGNRQWDIPRLRELLEDVLPDDNAFDDVEIDHEFETIGRRIMRLNGRRLDHLDLILLAIRDITEERKLEALKNTVMEELDHRVKNVLFSVISIVNQTMRQSRSLDEFGQAFHPRLNALARTQSLLIKAPDDDLELAEIVRLELLAQGGVEGVNFTLNGPPIKLSPTVIRGLAMAIHELTTNAVKHGALAVPEGRVEIVWSVRAGEGDEKRLWFRWREHRNVADVDPAHRGYGLRLLEGTFRNALAGTSQFTLHPDGAELVADFQLN